MKSVSLLTTCGLLGCAVTARAQEPVPTLDPTVVDAEDATLQPIDTEIITAEELENTQAVDLEDIFRDQPDVIVGGGQIGGQKVYVRGLEDALLNLEIDGAPQVGTTFHHQSKFGVEPDLLKAVAIEPGVGRATDGSGALGGSLKFETKDAVDLLEPGRDFGAILRSAYYTNSRGYKEGLTVFGNLSECLSYIASFSYLNIDDYEDAHHNRVDQTSAIQRNGFVKVSGDFQNGHTFDLSYEHYENGGPWGRRANIAGSLLGTAREPDTSVELARDTAILNYGFNAPDNDWLDLDFTAYYTDNTSDFDYVDPALDNEHTSIESLGFDLRNTSRFAGHTVTYGLDYRHDDYHADGWATQSSPNLYSGKEDVDIFGVYLQDDWQIIEQLLFTFGARFDDYDYTDQFDQNFSDSSVSPNATLVYSPVECLDFHAGYSEAFRGVQPGEVYLNGSGPLPSFPPSTRNAPDMKPEKAENAELGVRYDNGSLFASASVFRTKINNVIPIVDNPRTNIGDLESDGYELMLGYRCNGFSARVGVSESNPSLDGQDIDVINGIAVATGTSWVAALDYTHPDWGISCGYDVRFVEELNNDVISKKSYFIHGLYANWTPGFAPDLTLGVAVHNLFNKAYVDQASLYNGFGYEEPGRDVRFSATYRF